MTVSWVTGNTTSTTMGSLVEIKNINEIYIHYLHSETDTSDLADSLESQDGVEAGEVTINNCATEMQGLGASAILRELEVISHGTEG